jgi:hypothetical protein
VVLTSAPTDYSARGEAALVRSGRSGLRRVFHTPTLQVFAVPRPRPIVTGPHGARVLRLTGTRVVLDLPRGGDYRLAVRFSPYLHADGACLLKRPDGMTTVATDHGGRFEVGFHLNATRALATAVGGSGSRICDTD